MRASTDIEFIATGMATEIVVIVEKENSGLRIVLQIEMSGGQPAEASPHDNEIIDAGIRFRNGSPIALAFAGQFVRYVEGPIVIAAQARERWRIVQLARRFGSENCVSKCGARYERRCCQRTKAVQDVPARNWPIHAEVRILEFTHALQRRFLCWAISAVER